MGFGLGSKETRNYSTNTVTNTSTDNSLNAGGDGSTVISANSLLINDLSEAVARDAIAAGVKQTEFTTNTLKGIVETAARENTSTRSLADTALRTSQGITSAVVERAQTPDSASVSKILTPFVWVAGIAAVVLGLIFIRRSK